MKKCLFRSRQFIKTFLLKHKRKDLGNWSFIRLFFACDIQYDLEKLLYEKNTRIPHPVGIIIGSKVTIGNNCTIHQNATIGLKHSGLRGNDFPASNYPTIGNNVIIGAGAVILGSINIGDNAIIGANAVVIHDVPANAVVAGAPAKIIKMRDDIKLI